MTTVAAADLSLSRSIPWYLWAVAFASTSVVIGVMWDISWHRTIGRDTFWTAAHMAIYAGGVVAGLSCGWLALNYRIYADIVHESGFARTLTDTVAVPNEQLDTGEAAASTGGVQVIGAEAWLSTAEGRQRLLPDADDSWTVTPSRGDATEAAYALESGRTITWDRTGLELAVAREVSLRFAVNDADGAPATLQPYMGMMSHAAVSRDDRSVFVHLHPRGSINMAAQKRFERAEGSDTDGAMMRMRQNQDSTNVVTFPFVFEQPGIYRMWVQVKTESGIETGVWDVNVGEPRAGSRDK